MRASPGLSRKGVANEATGCRSTSESRSTRRTCVPLCSRGGRNRGAGRISGSHREGARPHPRDTQRPPSPGSGIGTAPRRRTPHPSGGCRGGAEPLTSGRVGISSIPLDAPGHRSLPERWSRSHRLGVPAGRHLRHADVSRDAFQGARRGLQRMLHPGRKSRGRARDGNPTTRPTRGGNVRGRDRGSPHRHSRSVPAGNGPRHRPASLEPSALPAPLRTPHLIV